MGLERALGGEFGLGLLITLILKRLERQHRDKSNSTQCILEAILYIIGAGPPGQDGQDIWDNKRYSILCLSTHCPQYRSVLEKNFPANMTPAEERGWFSSTVEEYTPVGNSEK